MSKETSITIKLEQELRDTFRAIVAAENANVSKVIRYLIQEYVNKKKEEATYMEFIRQEVALSRQLHNANEEDTARILADMDKLHKERIALTSSWKYSYAPKI